MHSRAKFSAVANRSANSTVTLWAASEGAPQQLGQARTGADGSFTLNSTGGTGGASLYLIAKGGQPAANAQGGDNPAIALMTVIGGNPRRLSQLTR